MKPRTHTDSENGNDTKRVHQLSENSDGSSDSSGDYFIGQEVSIFKSVHIYVQNDVSIIDITTIWDIYISSGSRGEGTDL